MSAKFVNHQEYSRLYNEGMSYEELSKFFGITVRYARVLRDRLGLDKRCGGLQRPVPENFEEFVKANGISRAQKHFHASWGTIYRWCEVLGLPRSRRVPTKTRPMYIAPVPEDWAEVAPTMYKKDLVKHYKLSMLQIRRIIKLTGIRTKPTVHELAEQNGKKADRQPATPRGGPTGVAWVHWKTRTPNNNGRDVYDMAADFLRRTFSNVFRCDIVLYEGKKTTWGDENDLPDHGKYHYCVGKLGPLERDNMLSIAEQRGFTVDPITMAA